MKRGITRNIQISIVIIGLVLISFTNVAGQAGRFVLPPYVKYKLGNGFTIYLMEQHQVPLIVVSAVFDAGAVRDGDKKGLASLTSEALLFGTEKYTKAQLEAELDFLGASLGTSASLETSSLNASFMKKDQEKVFDMISQVLMKPMFNQEEFVKRITRKRVELERAKESPGQVIGSYYNHFLYKEHPYGNPVGGTLKGIEGISVNDLQEFYKKYFTLDGACIAIAGDFDIPSMKENIKKYFGSWKTGKKVPVSQGLPEVYQQSPRVLLINKEDATQTQFLIGGKGIERSNPDYIAVQVINTIFGGRFTSWLNDELRVNAGLTYGAASSFDARKSGGLFSISSYTRNATTIQAIDLALEVMNRLQTKGVDDATLSSAKNYMKGQFPPRYETSSSKARLLTEMFVFGFDEKFINDFEKNVDGVTPEKVKEVVKKYFPSQNLQFVLIGKASEIKDKVSKYGKVEEKNIKDAGY